MITIMMRTANAAATGPITTFISSVDDEDTGAVLALAVVLYYLTNSYISDASILPEHCGMDMFHVTVVPFAIQFISYVTPS